MKLKIKQVKETTQQNHPLREKAFGSCELILYDDKAFAIEFYSTGIFYSTVLPLGMKIWNDGNANRKSSKMPCKIPWGSVAF